MKILTVTTLFPHAADPKHGIFVETRLRHFRARHPEAELTVIAPVPWFPFTHPRFGAYARFARAPRREQRLGCDVYHPRYLVIPKIGMLITPLFLALSLLRCFYRLKRRGERFDLIDGHYLYPDGVAIALAARFTRLPFVLTARGTDLNLIPDYPLPRRLIVWAVARSRRLVTVCEALREAALGLGIAADKVETLRNGVDLGLFSPPADRERLRAELGLEGPVLLSVGYLVERKGHHLIIEALRSLPGVRLCIAGDGPERRHLERLAERHGVADRVRFLGSLSQAELCRYYGASDLLVLASSREGWANVLLEAMACGTPVLASRVWGTPEVVRDPRAGRLTERNAAAIAEQAAALLAGPVDRTTVRAYAESFSWDETSQGLHQLFTRVLSGT